MNSPGQLQMFEPEGKALPPLVGQYLRLHGVQFKQAENLLICGFATAAAKHFADSFESYKNAQVCEMAFQFETLAGLA